MKYRTNRPPRHALPPTRAKVAVTRILAVLGVIVGAVLFAALALGLWAYFVLQGSIQEESFELPEEPVVEQPEAVKAKRETLEGAFNFLLVGSDSRDGQNYQDGEESDLNDVTMLVKVNETHDRVDIISFPRDLIIPIPCVDTYTGLPAGDKMLNTALTYGGVPCVSETIAEMTGETVNYAALVRFNSVENLTEAVGGVPLCFTQDIYNQEGNVIFNTGENNLSGGQALQFLRERKGFGDGSDLGRVSNQQLFVKAFLKKVQDEKLFLNPVKVYQLASITLDNLQLSSNIADIPTLVALGNTVNDMPLDEVYMHTAPNFTHPYDKNRLQLDAEGLQLLLAELNAPPVVEPPAAPPVEGDGEIQPPAEVEDATPPAPVEGEDTTPPAPVEVAEDPNTVVRLCG